MTSAAVLPWTAYYETRMAILHKKEEMDGYDINEEVIKYSVSDAQPDKPTITVRMNIPKYRFMILLASSAG